MSFWLQYEWKVIKFNTLMIIIIVFWNLSQIKISVLHHWRHKGMHVPCNPTNTLLPLCISWYSLFCENVPSLKFSEEATSRKVTSHGPLPVLLHIYFRFLWERKDISVKSNDWYERKWYVFVRLSISVLV